MLSSSHPPPEAELRLVPRSPRIAPPPVRGPIRLPSPRRWSVYAVAAAVWTSGVLWLVFHNFVRGQGDFGPAASPLEPWWLRLHGASAFAALWIFGLLWGVHVVNGWRARRRRWSGAVVFASVAVLIATGYGLYYAGGEALRAGASLVHWVIGLAAPLAFVWHRFLTRDRS